MSQSEAFQAPQAVLQWAGSRQSESQGDVTANSVLLMIKFVVPSKDFLQEGAEGAEFLVLSF